MVDEKQPTPSVGIEDVNRPGEFDRFHKAVEEAKAEAEKPPVDDSTKPAEVETPKENVGFNDPAHPDHPRFQELREQARVEKDRADKIELELKDIRSQLVPSQPKVSKSASALVELGLSEEAANSVINGIKDEVKASLTPDIQNLKQTAENNAIQAKISERLDKFKKANPDFDEFAPDMAKLYGSMSDKAKSELALDENAYSMLYKAAKYDKASLKKEPSKTGKVSGVGANVEVDSGWTNAKIAKLSPVEYKAKKPEILAYISKHGELK